MKTTILSADDLRTIVERVGLDELMDTLIHRLSIAIEQYDSAQTHIPIRGGFK